MIIELNKYIKKLYKITLSICKYTKQRQNHYSLYFRDDHQKNENEFKDLNIHIVNPSINKKGDGIITQCNQQQVTKEQNKLNTQNLNMKSYSDSQLNNNNQYSLRILENQTK
ncbi:hypothetical protein TTHERM_00105040 (macronuclear) [Tetrahymena thermophila SB210]|uniref:Uncharacterized protein n=1 Tax=Tetrahymena thermophila (strain SB210) TaxID=312017 RepID=Q234J2_TETTS|nr:hypothetical protein TTHERM_00105040 [Tetrahymena thermophila SB210]EAR92011.1 hypothetical protein TTHERM_00105040 [Tetrahymena thermophila SB210]|eukprot:XP_001012256.1 hypothetical protein TTHERM_00105040 [Tetrahymena thermophila SB210]